MISFEGRLAYASDPSSTGIRVLRFEPVTETFPLHQAGQYALLAFADYSPRPYSIANAPNGHTLEFHIRAGHSGAAAYAVSKIKIGEVVTISGYGGGCIYQPDCVHPLLLVAGGTGLAPLLAIMEQALIDAPSRRVMLYHGGRSLEDLYQHQRLSELTSQFPSFSYHPVLSHGSNEDDASIQSGLVGHVALDARDDYNRLRLYCSGPVEMMRHAQDLALAQGIDAELFHSDLTAFENPAPVTESLHER